MSGKADDWVLTVELLHTESEAHAVSGEKWDVTHISVLADNSDKTVYEFFNEMEMSLMGGGTHAQWTYLIPYLLSEEIKTETDGVSESYNETKDQLIQDYGSAYRIVSDFVVGLALKRNPAPGSKRERYSMSTF